MPVGDVVVAATSSAASTPGVAPERVLTVALSDSTFALIATLSHAYPLSARPLCQIVAAPTASNASLARLKHAMSVALSKSIGEPVERRRCCVARCSLFVDSTHLCALCRRFYCRSSTRSKMNCVQSTKRPTRQFVFVLLLRDLRAPRQLSLTFCVVCRLNQRGKACQGSRRATCCAGAPRLTATTNTNKQSIARKSSTLTMMTTTMQTTPTMKTVMKMAILLAIMQHCVMMRST